MTSRISFHRTAYPGIDAMTAVSDRSFPRHTHDQYGLGVVDTGGHASLSDRRQVEAGPGTLIAVNPGEVHDGRPMHGRPRAWRILYFDVSLLQRLRTEVGACRSGSFAFASAAFADPPLRSLFNALFALMTTPALPLGELRCESGLLRLAARLAGPPPAAQATGYAARAAVRRATELIEAELAGDLRLERLAAAAGMSRFQLLRAFTAAFRMPAHAYIIQRRLAQARRLIRSGTALSDAALQSGFSDQSHLTRLFLRAYGVTPGCYAASVR